MHTLFTAASLVVGLALVALALWLRARSRASRRWPSVPGQVIESRIEDTHLEMTRPVLRYRYMVGERAYVGFRAAFSGHGVSRAAMERWIQPYPVGHTVRVYYDPEHPASAVLDPGARSDWVYWLAFGAGFIALAAFLAGR